MNVLLSIEPKYGSAIQRSEKEYEFRKAIFKENDEENLHLFIVRSPHTPALQVMEGIYLLYHGKRSEKIGNVNKLNFKIEQWR